MKKIVALVLSLVMVLGLATTAFGAADQYDLYKATAENVAAGKLTATADTEGRDGFTIEKYNAVKNTDGSGNLEYYTINDGVNGYYYVKTTAPTVSDFAVTAAGKTDILFYLARVDAAEVKYVAEAEAFTKFGQTCGYLNQVNKDAKYFTVTKASADAVAAGLAKDTVYVAGLTGTPVLVGTEIVLLNTAAATGPALAVDSILLHNWAVTGVKANTDGTTDVTEIKCLNNCGTVVTKIYDEKADLPAGSIPVSVVYNNTTVWFALPVAGTTSAPEAGDKVNSAETFDAGIAMYVGMSVMAAAGSAVVLKKKD